MNEGKRDSALLRSLGLTEPEERAYIALLEAGGSPLANLIRISGLGRADASRAVRSLEAKGLLSRSAGRPTRLIPASPEVALDVLLLGRQEELERARLATAGFVERFKAPAARNPGELVEVILGRDAIRERFAQLQRSARHEVLGFDRPPYVTGPGTPPNPIEVDALGRGVLYRIIYDSTALEVPGQSARMAELSALGEQARVVDEVPMKLAIADRKIALVPLSLEGPQEEEALIVHRSSLLESLVMLFEKMWEQALSATQGQTVEDGSDPTVSDQDHHLLLLLAAGLKDSAIASQLGLSTRTVERRITRLMMLLNAETRFQLGLQAGLDGWLGSGEAPEN